MTANSVSNVDDVAIILPSTLNVTDLLGGELFGDELVDMYVSRGDFVNGPGTNDPELRLPSPDDVMSTVEKSLSCAVTPFPSDFGQELNIVDRIARIHDTTQSAIKDIQLNKKRELGYASDVNNDSNKVQKTNKSFTSGAISVQALNLIKGPSPLTLKLLNKCKSQNVNTPNPLLSVVGNIISPCDTVLCPGTSTVSSIEKVECVSSPNAKQRVTSAESNPPVKTEADFNAIAQAAVSNLITSGTNSYIQKSQLENEEISQTPDTSTAHITALTSPNWLSASTSSSEDGHQPTTAKRRCQNLTPDERVKQNRERNKRHARNTRLRKKAYIEELKRTLLELVSQRDTVDIETRQNSQRTVEEREVRFRVMEEFLRLKSMNEPNVSKWVAILEEGFALTVPMAKYRNIFCNSGDKLTAEYTIGYNDGGQQIDMTSSEQTLIGATQVMDDATLSTSFYRSAFNGDTSVAVNYQCSKNQFSMDGCKAMLEWTATVIGTGLIFNGVMNATFSSISNKMISAKMIYDTGFIQGQFNHKNEMDDANQVSSRNVCTESVVSRDDSTQVDTSYVSIDQYAPDYISSENLAPLTMDIGCESQLLN